jgi:hypothetical protein
VERRPDVPLLRAAVGLEPVRLWFPDAKDRGFGQGYRRAAARPGRAMSRGAVAWSHVVAIDLDIGVRHGHGDQISVSVQIAVRAGMEAQRWRKDKHDNPGRREPRQPPI